MLIKAVQGLAPHLQATVRYPKRASLIYRLSRWLESYSFASTPERVGIMEGLRAATSVAAMVLAALWLHSQILSWGAFGAFWVCLSDPGGSFALRLRTMGGFALGGTLVAWIASSAANVSPIVAGVTLLPLIFLSSLSRTYGPAAAQAGMLVCVVAVVAVAFPQRPEAALMLAAVFLLGSVWALALCLVVWRIHPHAPARRVVASVFGRLSDMTSGLLAHGERPTMSTAEWHAFNAEHRRSMRTAIERARGIVTSLEIGPAKYRFEIAQADRLFAGLIAIGHHLGERAQPLDGPTERHLVHRLLLLLAEARHQVALRTPDSKLLLAEAEALAWASSKLDTVIGRGTAASAQALQDMALSWIKAAGRPEHRRQERSKRPWKILRPVSADVIRHAARLAMAVAVAYAIAVKLDLAFSYWATMATVVVLQPLAATTWPRSVERMLGSVCGGLLAAALTVLLSTKLGLLVAIFPIAAATIAFRFVNYTVFVFFLTPLFVLVSELLQPGTGIASARMINNLVGSLVGVTASFLLWPDHDSRTTADVLSDAVTANLGYAAHVVGSPDATPDQLDDLRRKAGIASSAAETTRHRMILEGRRKRARLDEMARLLEALRALAGAATVKSLCVRRQDQSRAVYLDQLSDALAHAIRQPLRAPVLPAPKVIADDFDLAALAVIATATTFASGTSRRRGSG